MNLFILYVIFIFNENIFADNERSFYRVKISEEQSHSDFMIYDKNTSLATDGKINTCSMPDPDKIGDIWLIIILDRIYSITHIKLFFSRSSELKEVLHSIEVKISNGTEYQWCTTFRKMIREPEESYTLHCKSSTDGKYIALYDAWTDPVCDIHVFADLKSVNLAYKRPFIYKRPYTYHTIFHFENAELALDGQISTCSSMSTVGIDDSWQRIDLGRVYYISHANIIYKIIHEGIEVFVSNNNENYEEFLCATTSSLPKENFTQTQFLKCSRPIEGRYVTIKRPRESFRERFLICEFEVYSRDYPREMSNKSSPSCLPEEYKCDEGGCIHRSLLCDGTNDCPHAEDETACKVDNNHFKCKRRNESIPITSRCDGEYQCSDYSDEDDCFDVSTKLLKATFRGAKDFYICSERWHEFWSSAVCTEYNRGYHATNKLERSDEINKFIKITKSLTDTSGNSRMAAFEKSTTCNSDKFVGVDCAIKKDLVETCGKRGIPDALLGLYIIKGHDAEPGAWPWNVQIIIETDFRKFSCGGSLIKDRWILTSANCFNDVNDANYITVKMGTIVNDNIFVNSISVTHFIQHPNYNESSNINDIALLRLESSQSYSKYIKPICLPDIPVDDPSLLSYQHCMVAGFGHINRNKTSANKLQQTRMNIIEDEICADYLSTLYKGKLTKEIILERLKEFNEFCAGIMPLNFGPNACTGDSGAALVCKSKNGIWTQIGIFFGSYSSVYTSIQCEHSVFLEVYPYLDFIHTVTAWDYGSNSK